MINLPYIDSQDSSPNQKLSKIHRRVYPLSLFPSPVLESPLGSFRVSTPVKAPRHLSKPRDTKQATTSIPIQARPDKLSGPPTLRIKDFDKSNFKGLEDRYYYQANQLKLSPRCKVTIYTASPFHGRGETMGYGGVEKKDKNLNMKKGKKVRVYCNSKEKNKKKGQVRYNDEESEAGKTGIKLSRITSSKITFPALTVGQIIMRIRDLVIDPLKKELAVYRFK